MINLKQYIYETLIGSTAIQTLVWDSVHTWADDKDIRDGTGDIFPMITYYRISSSKLHNEVWIRSEVFQISAWSETMMGAEDISNAIVEEFNRTMTWSWKSCTLIGVNDSHDSDTKSYGVHARFSFVVYDPTY